MNYFKHIQDAYKQYGIKKPKGCGKDEVSALEAALGCDLPIAYQEYLFFMGKDQLGVLRGTNCFARDVLSNTAYLPELFKENNVDFNLSEGYLVFFCHQGYMVSWFELPQEKDNPTCYFYSEGNAETPKEVGDFVSFMSEEIMSLIKARSATRKWWQVWRL